MGWLDKAKDLADDHGDKIEDGIDKAADVAKDKLGDAHDDKIDAARRALRLLEGGGVGHGLRIEQHQVCHGADIQ